MELSQIKESFKNYGTWVALFALVSFFAKQFVPAFDVGEFNVFVNLFLTFLISLGIVSNPQAGKWFNDKTSEGGDK